MRWFVPRDVDGFFGLFVDNLVQLLLLLSLCAGVCGMAGAHSDLLYRVILPGTALSVVVGNLFYAWQAHRVAKRSGRNDVTALPFGINTPSLLIFVFFVMLPTYLSTKDPVKAWKMGMVACLGSGVIELAGAFVAESIRRNTPRAALLSTLSGIAIGFIAMSFALQIWTYPLVALLPFGLVLLSYAGRYRFPLGLPGGFISLLAGTGLAWLLWSLAQPTTVDPRRITEALKHVGFLWPTWCGGALIEALQKPAEWLPFLSVIIPMGLFNVIGSLQNIESAEAAGDAFETRSSLAVNGVCTIGAAFLGSCFPTTIYIGHPGWKALGARAGYSTLNAAVIAILCLSGAVPLVAGVVPLEAGVAIVLWIGIVITAQAFQTTPREHAPAVATGLFPAIAAWGATVTQGAFDKALGTADPATFAKVVAAGGKTMQDLLATGTAADVNSYLLHGLIVMERGYIFTCMILAAFCANLIDRRFFAAARWSAIGCLVTLLGLCHAYQLSGNVVDYLLVGMTPNAAALSYRAYDLALGYAMMAVAVAGIGWMERIRPTPPEVAHDLHA